MRQRRWIELFSDYECEIRYHSGKANVVANALSRKERENILAKRLHGLDQQTERKEDGNWYFMDRIWVPLVGDVRMVILNEAHKSMYSVYPSVDKMYHDLKCRSHVLWAEIREDSLIGPELVLEMADKVVLIKEKLKAERDHQKRYADKRRKPLEFEVGDRVLLRVSP
nr:putative reverse transcriptase domain-containing protein [Tanacetum cinerariifolium]